MRSAAAAASAAAARRAKPRSKAPEVPLLGGARPGVGTLHEALARLGGFLGVFLGGFLGGFLGNVVPCVFFLPSFFLWGEGVEVRRRRLRFLLW